MQFESQKCNEQNKNHQHGIDGYNNEKKNKTRENNQSRYSSNVQS